MAVWRHWIMVEVCGFCVPGMCKCLECVKCVLYGNCSKKTRYDYECRGKLNDNLCLLLILLETALTRVLLLNMNYSMRWMNPILLTIDNFSSLPEVRCTQYIKIVDCTAIENCRKDSALWVAQCEYLQQTLLIVKHFL